MRINLTSEKPLVDVWSLKIRVTVVTEVYYIQSMLKRIWKRNICLWWKGYASETDQNPRTICIKFIEY